MREEPHLDQEIIRLIDEAQEYKAYPKGYSTIDITTGVAVISGVRVEFETKVVLEGKLRMILPADFQAIPPEQVFKPEARPDLLIADDSGAIQITLAQTKQAAIAGDETVSAHKNAVRKILQALNSSLEWLEDGVKEVDGKQVFFFEFITPMLGAKVYNLTFFLNLQHKVLSGSFVCTDKKLRSWKPIFYQMLESLEVIASEPEHTVPQPGDYSCHSFQEGMFAIHNGNEYRLYQVGDHYRLISTNSKELANGFIARDGVFKKDVTKSELTAAYQLKLHLVYRGYQFKLGQQQETQIELIAQNCDPELARELQFEMSGSHEYTKWVAKNEIEDVLQERLPVTGFAMPEDFLQARK